ILLLKVPGLPGIIDEAWVADTGRVAKQLDGWIVTGRQHDSVGLDLPVSLDSDDRRGSANRNIDSFARDALHAPERPRIRYLGVPEEHALQIVAVDAPRNELFAQCCFRHVGKFVAGAQPFHEMTWLICQSRHVASHDIEKMFGLPRAVGDASSERV